MTQEEKAKAYDEALEKIREGLQPLPDGAKISGVTRAFLEEVFPELQKSEDEKIRNRILLSLEKDLMATKNSGCDTQDLEQCIAWVEKQSKPTTIDIDKMVLKYSQTRETCTNGLPVNCQIRAYRQGINDILEKQGKQEEPQVYETENGEVITYSKSEGYKVVEPKFKVGDWVVNNEDGSVGQVRNIVYDESGYGYDHTNGWFHSVFEKNYHLWTIEDAKDGDVLAGKIDGDNYILIFKTIKDGWIETHGHYYNAVNRFCAPSQLFCRSYQGTFTPATKEQRDLLFAKMEEAGFEWDAEKKELKKIEQKPAWSEEDENMANNLIEGFLSSVSPYQLTHTCQEIADWLKSIKDRIKGKED